jgi:Cytidylyltransferase-like
MPNVDLGPAHLKSINIYYGKERGVSVSFPQHQAKKDLKIGLMAGYFDPLHPMHLVLAAESIINGINDKVIFLPLDISQRKPNATPFQQRYGSLERILASFSPWFMPSELKRNRTNPDAVAAIRDTYPQEIQFNWIASSAGKSGLEIFKLFQQGCSVQDAIEKVISPYISRYLYFYAQSDEIVGALSRSPRTELICIPDKYRSIKFIHSTLIREGQLNWAFRRNNDEVDIFI